jgi:hypothetical protein
MKLVDKYISSSKLKKILLYGNIDSGKHSINRKNARKWINEQTSNERKTAAETLIDTVKYITYYDIVKRMEKAAKIFITKIKLRKYTVVLPTKLTKSSMIMSMLFLYFVKTININVYKNCINTIPDYSNGVVNVYVDDIDYSGNQATMIEYRINNRIQINIQNKIGKYITKLRNILTKNTPDIEHKIYNFINKVHKNVMKYDVSENYIISKFKFYIYNRRYINMVRKYLDNINNTSITRIIEITNTYILNLFKQYYTKINIYRIRAYQSTYSLKQPLNKDFLDITFIHGSKLTTFEELVKKKFPTDYEKRLRFVAKYWCLCDIKKNTINISMCSKLNIYTDYKVADPTSTFIVPLISGYVPIDKDYEYDKVTASDCTWSENHLTKNCDTVNKNCIKPSKKGNIIPNQRFYALINKCSYDEIIRLFFKKYNYNIKTITNVLADESNDYIRCPSSWYKHIDWNKQKINKFASRVILK